jgi:hypothetical protein
MKLDKINNDISETFFYSETGISLNQFTGLSNPFMPKIPLPGA